MAAIGGEWGFGNAKLYIPILAANKEKEMRSIVLTANEEHVKGSWHLLALLSIQTCSNIVVGVGILEK